MKELKKYAFAVWSILVLIGGVFVGSKLSKKEYNTTVKKVRAKKGGSVVITPSVSTEETKKRFRIRKKKR